MLCLALCDAGRDGGVIVQGVSHFGPLLSCLLASVSLCVKQETVPSKVLGEIITEKQKLAGDCSSEVEHLPGMRKVWGSIPRTIK